MHIEVISENENVLKNAFLEINSKLREHGVIGLRIQDIVENSRTLRI